MTRASGDRILATGFIADAARDASAYPSAGQDSSSPAFQAIYWRCIAVLLFSARITNPGVRAIIFSNVPPPIVDGIDLTALFRRIGAEHVLLPLTHRLPPGRTRTWGNVFYFMDIIGYLAQAEPDASLALVDSDVIVTASLDPLFARIATAGVAGYAPDTPVDANVNGLTRRRMTELADLRRAAGSRSPEPIRHLGGELLGMDAARMRALRPAFVALWEDMLAARNGADAILTEEHFWSIAFAAQGDTIGGDGGFIKRMWTSPRHNTVRAGDEALPLWHLPAEKRHGLAYLFGWLAARGFDAAIPAATFRARARRDCGVPAKTLGKVMRDGARQMGRRLGRTI